MISLLKLLLDNAGTQGISGQDLEHDQVCEPTILSQNINTARNLSLKNKKLKGLTESVGKHNEVPDSKFNSKELKKGIEIEHEHTNDSNLAKDIAKDHLSEIPDYYTRLVKMEDEAKKSLPKSKELSESAKPKEEKLKKNIEISPALDLNPESNKEYSQKV